MVDGEVGVVGISGTAPRWRPVVPLVLDRAVGQPWKSKQEGTMNFGFEIGLGRPFGRPLDSHSVVLAFPLAFPSTCSATLLDNGNDWFAEDIANEFTAAFANGLVDQ